MIVIGSVVDWALSKLVQGNDGAVTKQPAHSVGVATGGCEVEGGRAVLVSQAHVHPLLAHLGRGGTGEHDD